MCPKITSKLQVTSNYYFCVSGYSAEIKFSIYFYTHLHVLKVPAGNSDNQPLVETGYNHITAKLVAVRCKNKLKFNVSTKVLYYVYKIVSVL